jgi:Kef-type K+ transport system membrane component KefB
LLHIDAIPNASAQVILSLAVMLFAGFLMTRLTKVAHLPNVTGYILAGILIGPHLLNLIPETVAVGMDFVTDVALAFIAFGVGKYFKLERLRKNGRQVLLLTVFEALAAALLIFAVMAFVFRLSIPFSLLLGAIGAATAPASTIMTIRQYKAKGEFVDVLLQIVALDDAVALIAFSICAAVARGMESEGGVGVQTVVLPVIFNLFALAAGVLAGWLLHKLISEQRSSQHRLVLITGMLLAITGMCTALDISPLLACMVMGAVYINVSGNKKVFKQVNAFTPPIQTLFFVLSGMHLDLTALAAAGVIGVVYFLVRILGKYAGAWLGALAGKTSLPIRRYLGLALIPQAGVSIGLAVLGQRILPAESGALLSTIILSSGVLYEMVGPACAKAAIFLSGSVPRGPGSGNRSADASVPADPPDPEPAVAHGKA